MGASDALQEPHESKKARCMPPSWRSDLVQQTTHVSDTFQERAGSNAGPASQAATDDVSSPELSPEQVDQILALIALMSD